MYVYIYIYIYMYIYIYVSFTHRIASEWNSLPLTAKKTASLNTFKTLIA